MAPVSRLPSPVPLVAAVILAGPLGRAMAIVRRIIGVPDYAVYLRHAAECHPEAPPLTQDEFLEERLEAKYSRPGQRCC